LMRDDEAVSTTGFTASLALGGWSILQYSVLGSSLSVASFSNL